MPAQGLLFGKEPCGGGLSKRVGVHTTYRLGVDIGERSEGEVFLGGKIFLGLTITRGT
jgi:hypothetical protein